MKRYVACLVLPLLIAGCSSSKKNEAQSSPAAPAKAEEAQPAAKKTAVVPQPGDIVCKTGGDERTISVQPRESGCEVVYTKMGQANTVASAMNGDEHCKNVAQKIRGNLESAGFTCSP